MKTIENLEKLAEKKREILKKKHDSLRKLQESIKKCSNSLKEIELEIDVMKGEEYRKDINKLDLTAEEFEDFRKYVLSSKNNLLEVINLLSEEKDKKEGVTL